MRFRAGARPEECECDYHYTCGYCLRNAPPYFFTPTPIVQFFANTQHENRGPVPGAKK